MRKKHHDKIIRVGAARPLTEPMAKMMLAATEKFIVVGSGRWRYLRR